MATPVEELLSSTSPPVMLDGAMATELEKHGVQTNNALWSATAMTTHPEAIVAVHRSYLEAGSQVITTNSYQAALPTLVAAGIDPAQAADMITASAALALRARDEGGRDRTALVAGSIGPYGAHLADGSEYSGRYRLNTRDYQDFHRDRVALLAQAGVDLLAVETQPRLDEVLAVCQLLEQEHPRLPAMVSFSLGDDGRLPDGTDLADAARAVAEHACVVALGVNCIPRSQVGDALSHLATATRLPTLAYPNSGEQYDPGSKTWHGAPPDEELVGLVAEWTGLGVSALGGCCRTTPETIRTMARLTRGDDDSASQARGEAGGSTAP